MAEAEKDDWLDALDSPDDKTSLLDQSDLDDLLFDSKDQGQQAASPPLSAEEELDQSAIDALLSGSDDKPSSATPKSSATENFDLGQSDIDDLLASPQKPAQKQGESDPDQDEIDKLFTDIDSGGVTEENPFLAEEIDFKDVLDNKDSSPQSAVLDFNAEEFKLDADIPDLPEDSQSFNFNPPSAVDDTSVDSPADEPTAKITPEPEKAASKTKSLDRQGFAAKVKMFLGNLKMLLGVGGLAALLIVAGIFFMKGRTPKGQNETTAEVVTKPPQHGEPATAKQHEPAVKPSEPPPPEPPKQVPAPNLPPTVEDLEITMPPESSQLMLTLNGKDPENAPLDYEFQSMPTHGQLSGHAPNLVYTPKPDFSGQDSFTVRATDGKNMSAPATVKISRPAPAIAKEPPVKTETASKPEPSVEWAKTEVESKAQQEVVLAKNKTYTLTGTKGQIINWKKIWNETNFVPYKADVRIDIIAPPKHGTLKTIDKTQSIYTPNHNFRGTDTFTYQFGLGKLHSKSKTVSVTVQHKNRTPVLHLQQIDQSYTTGDTVILNASQTSDENRETLTFKWEQLSGVPVLIKPLNGDKSQVSFVAPSNFNTVSNPTLLIKVTATDQEGASDSKEIKITTKSRRSSAIWQGQ